MYPYTAPGATGPTSANPCFDSSPDFLEDLLLAVTNSDIVYNNLGYDPDLDSLYYDWADPIITFRAHRFLGMLVTVLHLHYPQVQVAQVQCWLVKLVKFHLRLPKQVVLRPV